MVRVTGTVAIAVIAFGFMPGAHASSMGWTWQRSGDIQQPVEQESPNFFFCGGSAGPLNCAFDPSTWVTNPTGCAWDVDDYTDLLGANAIAKDQTVSTSVCAVADGYDNYGFDNHPVQTVTTASTDALVVTLASDNGSSFTAIPQYDKASRAWTYRICTVDRTPGPYPVIDGSNGGTGIVVNWTLTITNASGQPQRKVTSMLQLGGWGLFDTGCPAP